jgi:drug/metabolite transporter (DMT)-like permease
MTWADSRLKTETPLRAYLALGLGMLSLGFSAILIRSADAPGTVTAFYRMAIGSVLMLIPFSRQVRQGGRGERSSPGDEGALPGRAVWIAILGGAFFGLDLTLWATGIVMSGATIPTLMANTAPLWVGLGAWLFFKERQSGIFWGGLLLAMLGAGVVLGQDFSRSTAFGVGALLGLGAAVFYGAYYLVTQQARSKLKTIPYFWITTTTSALVLLLVNLVLRRPFGGYDGITYLKFLAVGVFVQVFGWMAINYAQGFFPASIVSPTLLGQPVLTALIAWPLFGEILTPWHILGGAAVIAGVYLVHRSRGSKKVRVKV